MPEKVVEIHNPMKRSMRWIVNYVDDTNAMQKVGWPSRNDALDFAYEVEESGECRVESITWTREGIEWALRSYRRYKKEPTEEEKRDID